MPWIHKENESVLLINVECITNRYLKSGYCYQNVSVHFLFTIKKLKQHG